jgi:hypothetical protein
VRPFSAGELSRMQGTQESAMMDTVQRLERSVVKDQYNADSETFTPGTSYPGGFDPDPSTEGMAASEVAMMDAKLRMPLSVDGVIGTGDRVRITHRFGVALDSPPDFEVVGLPERGPSGLVLTLKRVTK